MFLFSWYGIQGFSEGGLVVLGRSLLDHFCGVRERISKYLALADVLLAERLSFGWRVIGRWCRREVHQFECAQSWRSVHLPCSAAAALALTLACLRRGFGWPRESQDRLLIEHCAGSSLLVANPNPHLRETPSTCLPQARSAARPRAGRNSPTTPSPARRTSPVPSSTANPARQPPLSVRAEQSRREEMMCVVPHNPQNTSMASSIADNRIRPSARRSRRTSTRSEEVLDAHDRHERLLLAPFSPSDRIKPSKSNRTPP